MYTSCIDPSLTLTDMDGFKLLETIALELDVPVISESLSPQPCSLSQEHNDGTLHLIEVVFPHPCNLLRSPALQ